MAKIKSAFFCQQCGYESPKWAGKCPSCGSWNSFVEEVIQRDEKQKPIS
ncbi:MAG: DNA repair protein RadA, partial [Chitinophagales bacterium]|nr:DNA repair protein RadA [Chitinophagales bacterium]